VLKEVFLRSFRISIILIIWGITPLRPRARLGPKVGRIFSLHICLDIVLFYRMALRVTKHPKTPMIVMSMKDLRNSNEK